MRSARVRPSSPEQRRFALELDLRYRVFARGSLTTGTGQTVLISSREIVFTADEALQSGMNAEIFIAWPILLSDSVGLQLVLQGKIVHGSPDWTIVQIKKYEFRTRGSADAPCAAVMTAGASTGSGFGL